MSASLNRSVFLLAQAGRNIELVQVDDQHAPKYGEKFARMPGRVRELWTVIKIFDREEHDQVVALVTLLGIDATKKLFKALAPEPSMHRADRVVEVA